MQNKRAKLEDEAHVLKEEQNKLEEKSKGLEQKMMEELRDSNKERRQDISQLESIIKEQEQKLKQISQEKEILSVREEEKRFLKKCDKCKKEVPLAAEECKYCGAKLKQDESSEENAPVSSEAVTEVQSVVAEKAKVSKSRFDSLFHR
jgi:chromosome segregation ATPase